MPIVDQTTWDNFVALDPNNIHLLQTSEWGELKSSFDWSVVRVITNGVGVQILFKKLPLGYSVGYIPRGSRKAISSLSSGELGREVDEICRKNKTVFLKLEPDCWDTELSEIPTGYTPTKHSIQPLNTIVVDISGSDEDVLGRMKQKCRYNIRLAEKKDIRVRETSNIEEFYDLMIETGGRDGFAVHSKDYYQKAYQLFKKSGKMSLLVAEFEGRPLASLMVFAVGDRSWYIYGASSDRERNRMPAYLLQWKAILWAKQMGCNTYDLWGIPDEPEVVLENNFETRNDGLWGVYRFKRGFGGKVLRAHPAIDKIFMPLIYKIYQYRQK